MPERELLEDMEREIYIHDLEVEHHGFFNFEELIKLIEKWAKDKNYYLEYAKSDEKVTSSGKNKKYKILMHSKFTTVHYSVMDLNLKIEGMTDEIVEVDGRKTNMNKGKVVASISGMLLTSLKSRWETKASFYFLRGIIDKFIYKINRPEVPGKVVGDAKDLASKLRGLLESYEYRISGKKGKHR